MADRSGAGWRRVLFNPAEGRLRAGWRLFATIPVQFVAWFLAGIVFFQIAELAPPSDVGATVGFAVGLLVVYFSVVLAVLAMARWVDRRPWNAWLDHPAWLGDLAAGLAIGVAMASAAVLAGLLTGAYRVTGTLVAAPETPLLAIPGMSVGTGATPAILVVVLLFAVHVGVGVSEELLIRGYLLTNLAEGVNGLGRVGARGAIAFASLATAVLFGALHLGNPNVGVLASANIVLAGLFFAGTYVATGSLWIPIGLHIAWNFTLAGVYGLPVSGLESGGSLLAIGATADASLTGGGFGPEAGLVFYPALAVGVLASLLWLRYTRGSIGIVEGVARYVPPVTATDDEA